MGALDFLVVVVDHHMLPHDRAEIVRVSMDRVVVEPQQGARSHGLFNLKRYNSPVTMEGSIVEQLSWCRPTSYMHQQDGSEACTGTFERSESVHHHLKWLLWLGTGHRYPGTGKRHT